MTFLKESMKQIKQNGKHTKSSKEKEDKITVTHPGGAGSKEKDSGRKHFDKMDGFWEL